MIKSTKCIFESRFLFYTRNTCFIISRVQPVENDILRFGSPKTHEASDFTRATPEKWYLKVWDIRSRWHIIFHTRNTWNQISHVQHLENDIFRFWDTWNTWSIIFHTCKNWNIIFLRFGTLERHSTSYSTRATTEK